MNYKILTASNDAYILTLCDFVNCYINEGFSIKNLIIYDIGISNENIKRLYKINNYLNIQKFNFSKYPEHVSFNKYNGLNMSYAFKPIIIYNEIHNIENIGTDIFIWMDSANRFTKKNITDIYQIVSSKGIYTPTGPGKKTIESIELNHPKTCKLLGITKEEHHNELTSICANLIACNFKSDIAKDIISDWYKYSLQKDVIVPEGSSRNNHRQDQSVLSILLFKASKKYNVSLVNEENVGVHFWVKKDKIVNNSNLLPFKLLNKSDNTQLAIIYSDNLNEATDIYINRKEISREDFNKDFIVAVL
tara:strand:- start:8503 stop:9417 length:915 start_codon:yes stop_codon:yes gene_type:complete